MARAESRRPRILYISFFFPPSRASGVYRARATANYLAAHDWDVTVCAAPMRFLKAIGSADEALSETVDPRVEVHRPGMDMFRWEDDVRRFGWFRRTFPVLAKAVHDKRQSFGFPEEAYASWGRATARTALRLHARRRFDVVLATGNPFAAFAAARTFGRLANVPYALDYRDSWTLNLFTDQPKYPDGHPAWAWERRLLKDASAAVFVNEALRRWHAERYPELAGKMMVVLNGWDPDLLTVRDTGPAHRPLRFGYLGTLTKNQPVAELAAAFRRARAHPDLADAELNIHGHLGFFATGDESLLDRLSADPASGIHYRGPVSKTQVASVYEQNDVLVFLAGGGRYVTSGKVFEYMASGRPIVSVHSPESAAVEVLDGYPLWFNPGGLDIDAVAQSMIAAGKAARDATVDQRAQARAHAAGYAREALLAPLEVKLRELSTAKHRRR